MGNCIGSNRQVLDPISFDINPTSRQLIENLIEMGLMEHLVKAGARFHKPMPVV